MRPYKYPLNQSFLAPLEAANTANSRAMHKGNIAFKRP